METTLNLVLVLGYTETCTHQSLAAMSDKFLNATCRIISYDLKLVVPHMHLPYLASMIITLLLLGSWEASCATCELT